MNSEEGKLITRLIFFDSFLDFRLHRQVAQFPKTIEIHKNEQLCFTSTAKGGVDVVSFFFFLINIATLKLKLRIVGPKPDKEEVWGS